MKVVINDCFGGFGLSKEAEERYAAIRGVDRSFLMRTELVRDDPALVQVVEELGDRASGYLAHLKIVEIPSDVQWQIEEYDGNEWVAETHRTWR